MKVDGRDSCGVNCFNPEAVSRGLGDLPDQELALRLAEVFKTLGDRTRVNILSILAKQELCVCEMAEILEMSSSAVSHQLRVLRGARLVKFRKEGKMAYYSLDDEHVVSLFQQGLEHVAHS